MLPNNLFSTLRLRRPCAFSLCCLVLATLHADQLLQTFNGTLKLGDNVPEGLDQVTLNVIEFDPGLGTLTAVQFELTSALSSGVTFYHPAQNDLTFTYTPRNYVGSEFPTLAGPPALVVDHTLPIQTYTDSTPYGGSLWQPTASDTATATFTTSVLAELPQYTGTGSFPVVLTLEDRCIYTASHPLTYINDKYLQSDFTLQVRYTYVPVPEPATAFEVGGGLLLLAGWWRHRCRGQD
jgi:hypothetical protein